MSTGPYATELLVAAGPRGSAFAGAADLEATLERLVADARSAWPDLGIAPAQFVRHLALHLPESVLHLSRLHASDLYLACGCFHGDRRALEHFDRRFLARVRTYVGKVNATETFADDVRQLLREKLFVADPGALPKI